MIIEIEKLPREMFQGMLLSHAKPKAQETRNHPDLHSRDLDAAYLR
jgi:hypothetical protein